MRTFLMLLIGFAAGFALLSWARQSERTFNQTTARPANISEQTPFRTSYTQHLEFQGGNLSVVPFRRIQIDESALSLSNYDSTGRDAFMISTEGTIYCGGVVPAKQNETVEFTPDQKWDPAE